MNIMYRSILKETMVSIWKPRYFFGFSLFFLLLQTIGLSQTTITQWNFNSNPADGATGTGLTTPSVGSGSASLAGGTTASFNSGDSNGGSTDPASGDDSGWNVTTYAAQGTGNKTRGVQFLVSTVGFQNIQVKWDQRHSNTGPRHVQLQYTTDGSNWIDFGAPFEGTAGDTWFNNRSLNLGSITAANNNANFGIRIVAAFAPGTSNYVASSNSGTYSTTGTWRFDMVTISGTPTCTPPAGTLTNNGPICPGTTADLTFNASNGTGPFSIVVNGLTYNNVNSGSPFVTLTEGVDFTGSTNFTLSQITDNNNCVAIDLNEQTTVSVSSQSSTTITASPNPVAQGAVLNLSVPSAGAGASYNWSGSGVVNANANTTTAVPLAPGQQTYAVTVTNANNCVSNGAVNVTVLPIVSLSVSANAGSEANSTSITVTASSSAVVTSNQTVNLGVSGTGITADDYYLTRTVITIPAGQSTGSITFVIADDGVTEGDETAVLTISTPSAGIALGSPVSQNILISDNTCGFLRKAGGTTSANGAEIPAFDPASNRVYVVAGSTVEVFSLSNSGALALISTLSPGFVPPSGTTAIPNSVAIKNGIVAVSYAIVTNGTNAQQPGRVSFFVAADGTFLNEVTVGALPDMVTFTPDGQKLLTANEGEPNSYGQGNSFDPEGSVSIIDLSGGVANATVQTATFTAFNGQLAALRASGVRIFGPNATVAQDVEPEYIVVDPNGLTARVTLQENNAIALLDIPSATITAIQPLGLKNHNVAGKGLDASDMDGSTINIQPRPVFGMYQPDAIVHYRVAGQDYYLTANEGDSRAYTGFNEEVRVGSSAYVLDPTVFPNAASLKANAVLGRLQLTNATGDTDGDGDYDQIQALGARSFSIWNASGTQVFDSGDQFEQITAAKSPSIFNSDGATNSFDGRSDNKGPEPEGAVIGQLNGKPYAFIGLERTGDIMVYDVSNPNAPSFVQYINTPEDLGLEGLVFVPAGQSPTGKPLLITASEVSRTVSVFEVNLPVVTISGTPNFCAGSSTVLSANGSSHNWSTGATTASVSINTAGIYTVTISDANQCTASATVEVSQKALPAVSCPANLTVCASAAPFALSGASPAGGVYSGNGVSAGSFNPANAGAGTHLITYTFTNADGCVNSCAFVITVNAPPTTITASSPVSANSTGNAASVQQVSGATYAWSISNGTITAGLGTSAITYTAGATGSVTLNVTVTLPGNCSGTGSRNIVIGDAPRINCPASLVRTTSADGVTGNCTFNGTIAHPTVTGSNAPFTLSLGFSNGAPAPGGLPTGGSVTPGQSDTYGFQAGTTVLTYTASDINNNTASCAYTILVTDNEQPAITCPTNITRGTDAGLCSAAVVFAPTATDNCITPAISQVSGLPSGSSFPKGISTLVFRATDAAGLTRTCSFRVTVNDTQAPAISCPANIVKNTDVNLCNAVTTYTSATFTDNCSGGSVLRISGLPSGVAFPIGTSNVTFRATDGSGNIAQCSFSITIRDMQLPTLTCPLNIQTNVTPGQCSKVVNYANPTYSDNCSGGSISLFSGLASGSVFAPGSTTVIWRAFDNVANSNTCSFLVTVVDNELPVINCPPSISVTGSGNPCGFPSNQLSTATASDNCAVTNLSSNAPANLPAGVNTITWTAADAANNLKTCSQTVTVNCGASPNTKPSRLAETDLGLVLSPNPASEAVEVFISGEMPEGAELSVFDALGRQVWRTALGPDAAQQRIAFSLDDYSDGVYQISLRTAHELITKSLVVKRR